MPIQAAAVAGEAAAVAGEAAAVTAQVGAVADKAAAIAMQSGAIAIQSGAVSYKTTAVAGEAWTWPIKSLPVSEMIKHCFYSYTLLHVAHAVQILWFRVKLQHFASPGESTTRARRGRTSQTQIPITLVMLKIAC